MAISSLSAVVRLVALLVICGFFPIACSALLPGPWHDAGAISPWATPPTTPVPAPLYARLGGTYGLWQIMETFTFLAHHDPTLGPRMPVSRAVTAQVVQYLCVLTDGPCLYHGPEINVLVPHWTDADFDQALGLADQALRFADVTAEDRTDLLVRLETLRRQVHPHPFEGPLP